MKTWMQLAFMAVVVTGIGLASVVLAFATGDWGLLMGLIFLGVGLLMAWFVPAARREQKAHHTDFAPRDLQDRPDRRDHRHRRWRGHGRRARRRGDLREVLT